MTQQQDKEFRYTIQGRVVSVRALLVDDEPRFSATDIASSLGYAKPLQFVQTYGLPAHAKVIDLEPYFN